MLGLPRAAIPAAAARQGVITGLPGSIVADLEARSDFRRRGDVEGDPRWKQLIPYLVVRDGSRVFLMRRTRAGGDERLHERYSIGVGGHVNPEDWGIGGGLRREWLEELRATWQPRPRLLGLINDDADPVGAVHLGVVYEADAAGRLLSVRERHKLSGSFVEPAEVARVHERLETWSRLLFDHLWSSRCPMR